MNDTKLTTLEAQEFDRLKAIGWQSLKGKDRDVYLALKEKHEAAEAPKEPSKMKIDPPKPGKEKITVTKDQLDKMIKEMVASEVSAVQRENRQLKNKPRVGEWREFKPVERGNHMATFRVWQKTLDDEPGLIVDLEFVKNIMDEETGRKTKPVYRLTLLHNDGKTSEEDIALVDLTENHTRETVEIIEMTRKPMFKNHGEIRVPKKNKEGYIMSTNLPESAVNEEYMGDSFVPLNEWRDNITCTVRRESGQTFKINGNRLNL